MRIADAGVGGAKVLEPAVFPDERGFVLESWNARTFAALGIHERFVQDNHCHSRRGTLRGLHYQLRQPQGKLVRVVDGEIFDVVVDICRSSPTFGRWFGIRLSALNKQLLWVPPGMAHGFVVLSETADVLYKCTDYYAPECERTILWNDPALGIHWPSPADIPPLLSPKDARGQRLAEAESFP